MTNDDRAAGIEFLNLFPVPMAIVPEAVPSELIADLRHWILEEYKRDPGVQRSNAGGWHSRPDLPNRGVPQLDQLFALLIEQVREVQVRVGASRPGAEFRAQFLLQAWATIMNKGDFVHVHDHADAHWSAVFYLDAGLDEGHDVGGRIAWLNPIGPHRFLPGANLCPTTFELTPRTGLLVIFPGWLRHMVQPYRGIRPRIAIAANVEVRLSRSIDDRTEDDAKSDE